MASTHHPTRGHDIDQTLSQLIRIRSRDGNFRFELSSSDDIHILVDKAHLTPLAWLLQLTRPLQIVQTASKNVDPASITISNQPRGNETLATRLTGRNLQSLGLKYAHWHLCSPLLMNPPDMVISSLSTIRICPPPPTQIPCPPPQMATHTPQSKPTYGRSCRRIPSTPIGDQGTEKFLVAVTRAFANMRRMACVTTACPWNRMTRPTRLSTA